MRPLKLHLEVPEDLKGIPAEEVLLKFLRSWRHPKWNFRLEKKTLTLEEAGRRGAAKRNANLTHERRSEIARKAAQARWAK